MYLNPQAKLLIEKSTVETMGEIIWLDVLIIRTPRCLYFKDSVLILRTPRCPYN